MSIPDAARPRSVSTPNDPFEDTESRSIECYQSELLFVSTPNDPFEDTERDCVDRVKHLLPPVSTPNDPFEDTESVWQV